MGGVITDAAVPEGHAGLHGFLYGDGGAEAHDSAGYSFREVLDCMHRMLAAICKVAPGAGQ